MKRFLLASSISLMLLSTAAMAAPGHGNGNGHGGGNPHADQAFHGEHGDRHDAYEDGHHYAKGHKAHHDNGLHLGQHKFERGERVPAVYLERRYYVENYRVYNLAPPPRGYRWVRPDDGRYLLISTATGLISQILGY
ncbi:MAG TPA: RcnB family protein [Luteimonas sp.]|jgi:Ni/Co efflux regulator RcnB|nr:RcnB family protein [Luteimonas sp.]